MAERLTDNRTRIFNDFRTENNSLSLDQNNLLLNELLKLQPDNWKKNGGKSQKLS